ncbi:ParA family protein [Neobacillus mesonae]|nr:ParA family protein [Neobacillus mesonae]
MCLKGEMHLVIRKVVLASRALDYIDALLDYVQGSPFARKFQVSAFSQPEAMMSYLNELDRSSFPDLIVGELEFVELLSRGTGTTLEHVPVLLLTEHPQMTDSDFAKVKKYQPLPLLLSAWEEAMLSSSAQMSRFTGEQTLVIGVTSASGGCGRTTVALNLAKQLGRSGYSVFYLNLETLDSTKPFLQTGKPGDEQLRSEFFSRLLYLIKANHSGEKSSYRERGQHIDIKQYVSWNERIKSDCFYPAKNRKELLQMTRFDVDGLIKVLIESGHYQYIIADHDSIWDERAEGIMDKADLLIWLLSDDVHTLNKAWEWNQYHEQLDPNRYGEILGKTRYVINRFMGSVVNPLPEERLQTELYLPYIPSWKQMREPDLLLNSPIYQKEMWKLCESMGILKKEHI